MRLPRSTEAKAGPGYLDGQLLVAMPGMGDERFSRTVIYICAHSPEGAMGIVVNKPAADLSMPDLLVQLDIIPETDLIRLPRRPRADFPLGARPEIHDGTAEDRRRSGHALHGRGPRLRISPIAAAFRSGTLPMRPGFPS